MSAAKAWESAYKASSAAMADAIAKGDWEAAKGWGVLASWQFERMEGVRPS